MAGFREGHGGEGGEGGSRGDRVWGVIKFRVCLGLRSYWGSEVVGARGVTGRREAHGGWSDMVEEVTRFRG